MNNFRKVRLTVAKDSILAKAQKSDDIKTMRDNYKLRSMLIGDSKSGKTTSATSLPGRKLLVDFDNRAESIAGTSSTEVIRIFEPDPDEPTGWNEAISLRDEIWAAIKAGSFAYDGVIWDGMSGMTKLCMNFCLSLRTAEGKKAARGFGGGPAEHHYNPYMQEMSKFIFNCLAMPIHTVFTGHLYVYEDKHTNKLEWWPKLFGNIRTEVGSWFNEVYYCYNVTETRKEGKRQAYYWQTASDSKLNFVGSSLNQLGKYWQSPVELDPLAVIWGFQKLLDLRFTKK